MDERKILIMKNGKDITIEISNIENEKNIYRVQYNSSEKKYPYKKEDIKIYNNPVKINVEDYFIAHKNNILFAIDELIDFDEYCKVFYTNGTVMLYEKSNVHFSKIINNQKNIKNVLKYLIEVSKCNNENETGRYLTKQLERVKVQKNSVLGKFIDNKLSSQKYYGKTIYPFQYNLKQSNAVHRALSDDLSIIQGPPGTGKTQTILNIIANYVANDKSVAVLSGNNSATLNVEEKMKQQGYSAINAVLGKKDNIEEFFRKNQEFKIDGSKVDLDSIYAELSISIKTIDEILHKEERMAKRKQDIQEIEVERQISEAEYLIQIHKIPSNILNYKHTSRQLLKLAVVLEKLPEKAIYKFFYRARLLFRFGFIRVKDIYNNKEECVKYLKKEYYSAKTEELQIEIDEIQTYLESKDSQKLKKDCLDNSKIVFNNHIQVILEKNKGKEFDIKNYRYKFSEFSKKYPVVFSTTHAIASCTGESFLYDCIIIDESSQVDLITATIAFSKAKKVVLVGDSNQITHIVNSNKSKILQQLFVNSQLDDCYDYVNNNILQSVEKKCGKSISQTLLAEHYRCDPQIINFCNKRFYNNELIIKTEHEKGNGIEFRTHKGNYQIGRWNQREVDIISKEILQNIKDKDVGIIAPFNDQVDLLKKSFSEYDFNIETVHKFQGKEKDEIVMSTVVNEVKFYEDDERIDFLNNPNLINVAISRARKKLHVLVSKKLLKQDGVILKDLLDYNNYYCNETKIVKTKVYSVFDLMYKDYASVLEPLNQRKLHISDYDSENIIGTVIKDICSEGHFGALTFIHNYPLKNVVKENGITDMQDLKFLRNPNTHCDFVIYSLLNKEIKLVVEVDGLQHRKEVQANRDKRKDRLLYNAGVKILRLPTTSIECQEKIEQALGI